MKDPLSPARRFRLALANIALVLLGVASALGLMELLLRTFPNWVPREVRVSPPVRRVQAFVDQTYEIRLSDGDLYYWMKGKIAPLSPEADRVVAQVHMTTDAHGFRNALPEQSRYDVVALGDSFTRASGVAAPWPQKLAESAGIEVLNLGEVGAGPQQELELLQQYGLAARPQWVILAYFEGNDLYDAGSYAQATPFILARFGQYLLSQGVAEWRAGRSDPVEAPVVSNYPYPISVTINDANLEMAFFSYYISWLSVSGETIAASENYRLVRETILKIRELSEDAQARLLLAYLPCKAHVYLPYVKEAETLSRVFSNVPTLELNDSGYLDFTTQKATPELTQQYIDVQAQLLADFAAEQGIAFLDLTSTFQVEAGTGAELYYPFDTHWNQRGHDLAAQTIAEYIAGAR